MTHRPADLAGGLFWVGCGATALALFARDLLAGVGWVYYSGVLLAAGVAMLVFGGWLVRRSNTPRGRAG